MSDGTFEDVDEDGEVVAGKGGSESNPGKMTAAARLVQFISARYVAVMDTGGGGIFFRSVRDLDAAPVPARDFAAVVGKESFEAEQNIPNKHLISQVVDILTLDAREEAITAGMILDLDEIDVRPDDLVADVEKFINRYVKADPNAILVFSLWCIHTHAIDAADFTPYMVVTSPTKGCGKTTLAVKVAKLLVPNPQSSANVSGAALFRTLAKGRTFLLDETDGVWKGNAERAEDIRNILNAGFSRSEGHVLRCVGQGTDIEEHEFPVFGAKTISGIGRLVPETVKDRGFGIRLQKARKGSVQKLRERTPPEDAGALMMRMAAWAKENIAALAEMRPALPDELDGRGEDISEPLICIADLLGCGERARRAVVALRDGEVADTELTLEILGDVRDVFVGDRMTSADLLAALVGIEGSKWASWWGDDRDRRKGAMKLSQLLSEFDINPNKHHFKEYGKSLQGYLLAQFEEPWRMYLKERIPSQGGSEVGMLEERLGTEGLEADRRTEDSDSFRPLDGPKPRMETGFFHHSDLEVGKKSGGVDSGSPKTAEELFGEATEGAS